MKRTNRLLAGCALFALVSLGGKSVAGSAIDQAAPAESAIRAVLETQVAAWNRGDIDRFMEGYWKSANTEFVGAAGVTRGWQAVLDRYHKNYPDQKAMGRLSFSQLEVHMLCADAAFVTGEFHLERAHDNPEGVFTLNFRKFSEGWRIVADHTTAFAPSPHEKSE